MKIEHFAFNVADPVKMADWYITYLGMTVARKLDEAPYTHFLTDSSGSVMIETYNNPKDEVPNYAEMKPQLLHLAFVSEDPSADQKKLVAAGATLLDETHFEDGSHLAMLRDPWGLAIQLCKRGTALL
jgi:catechol 2,3-dioxygenase-like lactoylglutathione lyase family enzyme